MKCYMEIPKMPEYYFMTERLSNLKPFCFSKPPVFPNLEPIQGLNPLAA